MWIELGAYFLAGVLVTAVGLAMTVAAFIITDGISSSDNLLKYIPLVVLFNLVTVIAAGCLWETFPY